MKRLITATILFFSTALLARLLSPASASQDDDGILKGYISAEDGSIQISNESNGWLLSNSGSKCYSLGFKQADRDSNTPESVASISINGNHSFNGQHSIKFEINAHQEINRKSTAFYKVAMSILEQNQAIPELMVSSGKNLFHGFAMMIDPDNFSLPDKGHLIFEQFWQGSPFHPPVSLAMISKKAALEQGWSNTSPSGSFALLINNEDRAPLGKEDPIMFNLGPIQTGQWLRWVVETKLSPVDPEGFVRVNLNDRVVEEVDRLKIGYTPGHNIDGHKVNDHLGSIDVMLYRTNGGSHQTVYFDDIRLATSFKAAQPRKGYVSETTCQ